MWFGNFLKRQKEISLRLPEPTSRARMQDLLKGSRQEKRRKKEKRKKKERERKLGMERWSPALPIQASQILKTGSVSFVQNRPMRTRSSAGSVSDGCVKNALMCLVLSLPVDYADRRCLVQKQSAVLTGSLCYMWNGLLCLSVWTHTIPLFSDIKRAFIPPIVVN